MKCYNKKQNVKSKVKYEMGKTSARPIFLFVQFLNETQSQKHFPCHTPPLGQKIPINFKKSQKTVRTGKICR